MIKLLKTQWLILRHSRAFVLFFILSCISTFLIPAIVAYLSKSSNDTDNFLFIFKDAFTFPIVFNTVNILSKIIIIPMISLLIVIGICQELDFKTYRLHLLSGSTKKELWQNSIVLIVFLALTLCLISCLSAFFIGIFNIKNASEIRLPLIFRWYLLLFMQCVGYFSFATTFALLFRKIGVVLILYILWFLLIERSIAQIINYNGILKLYPLGYMLPGKSLEGLTHLKIIEDYIRPTNDYQNLQSIFALGWCLVSNLTNYVLYQKREY